MQYDEISALGESDPSPTYAELGHDAEQVSFGIADVLFPVAPPPIKGARLVIGKVSFRRNPAEHVLAHYEAESMQAGSAEDDQAVDVSASAPSAEPPPSQKPATRLRRRDRAARNRSLLAAAGLDRGFDHTSVPAGSY